MALPKPTGAIARLTGANNNSYDATTNPLGLADGGHRQNWVENAQAEVDIAQWAESLAGDVKADADRFEAAVAAIEAGPVTSVNGRSGAVTGLVEQTAFDALAADLRQEVEDAIEAIPPPVVLPQLAPIVVSSPPDNTTASATQTFVAKLQGYGADTLGYYSLYGYPQASRTLNVYLASSPSVIFKTTTVTGGGNTIPSVNLQTLGLSVSTDYLAEIVFTDVLGNTTKSAKSRFTTPAQFRPSVGDAYQGGFVIGQIVDGGVEYINIVSPKSSGETTAVWDTQNITIGAASRTNGPANNANPSGTQAAVQFCRSRTIGGYNDWYLPAIQEWLNGIANNNALPAQERIGTATYWTSTEVDATSAKCVTGPTGGESFTGKGSSNSVRAFRRVAA